MVHYAGGEEELYDSQADRFEWTNLATEPKHADKLARLRALAPQEFAPFVKPTDKSLIQLKWHPSSDTAAPPSNPDGNPFEVVFVNNRPDPVKLLWIDRQGKPQPLGMIAAGKRQRQNTRPGAVWAITDSSDQPLGHFVVGDRAARAVIPVK